VNGMFNALVWSFDFDLCDMCLVGSVLLIYLVFLFCGVPNVGSVHLVDHVGTWTISPRGCHPFIKSVYCHGYGLLDILIF
jgi:hypothetical protein